MKKEFRKILKCDENSKNDEPLRANFAAFANALCYLNATPLSVAVLAPCAWGKNLACGGAWQRVLNSAKHNTAWRGEMGSVWAGLLSLSLSLSLVARTFWHAFAFNLKNFSHIQILKHKFKFFTQNSKHFINLSQILSLMQGFFIFLPQIFAQFLLINSTQRKYYGRT